MKKAIQLIVVASCLALALAGCKTEDTTPPAKPDAPDVKSPDKTAPGAPAPEVAKTTASSVGVSKDTILVGQTGPQTGPAALWGAVARGTATYFAMINEEGGIHGRKLKLLIRDDSYQPTKTKAAVMELAEKEQVFAFVGGVGTGTGMAVKGYLSDKKIPWIGPGSGSSHWASKPGRYLFSVYPTYETEARALVRYLVKDEKKKIGFFYQNDDFGKEGLIAARDELKKLGLEMVVDVSAEMTEADLSSHVLMLKQADPDAVIMFLMPKHAAIALGTAAKLKFKPQWASASPLSDAPLMNKITKGLWNGVIFSNFIELPDSDNPQVIKYKAAYEKFGKVANDKEQFGIFFLAGFMFAEPFVQALKNVGPDLDREKLVTELEKLNKWSGGIGHQITYGPHERQGQKAVFLAKCVDGKAKKISDWITVE